MFFWLSVVTGLACGYLAWRATGRPFRSALIAFLTFDLLLAVPLILLLLVVGPFGVDVRESIGLVGAQLIVAANLLLWGWVAWVRFAR